MQQDNMEIKFPIFFKTADYLQNKTNFFKNSLPKLFSSDFDFELAERICKTGLEISSNNMDEYFKNVDGLIDLSMEFLMLQVKLEKTGKYLYSSVKEVEEQAYSTHENHPEGPNYMWGLYFSEIFWKVHHYFTNFFLRDFANTNQSSGLVLEIPSGTGFFLNEFLRKNPSWHGIGIDMSDTSIEFSKKVFKANNISEKSYEIIKKNFLDYENTEKFDRIICGEFLEHVEDPVGILKKLRSLLKENGKIFLTVAVWAANIDHIYLYNSAQEVRNHIRDAQLRAEKELVQSVFEKHADNPEKEKIPVIYAAILSKKA